jgi:hypothetical protein
VDEANDAVALGTIERTAAGAGSLWADALVTTITIGGGANQTTTTIGRSGQTTNILGPLCTDEGIEGPDDGTGIIIGLTPTGASTGSTFQAISLTTTERDQLVAANGMLVYNETTGSLEGYNGSWLDLGAGAGGASSLASTLAVGNTTGGNDLEVSTGDSIVGADELTLVSTTTGAASLDSGTTGNVNVGTGANAKAVTVGSTTSTSSLTLQAGTGAMTLTAGGIFDVNATGAVTVDGTSVSVGGTLSSDITVTGSAQSLVLEVAGGGAQQVRLQSAGTGTDSIDIDSSAGGVAINGITGFALGASNTTASTISSTNTTASTNTTLDIDCINTGATAGDATLSLDASSTNGTATIQIGEVNADEVNIGLGAGDINIGNAAASMTLDLDSGSGGTAIDSTGAISIDAATASNLTVTGSGETLTLEAAGGGVAQQLILNSAGTNQNAIRINASAGGIDVDSSGQTSINAGNITLDATTTLSLDATGTAANFTLQANDAGTSTMSIVSSNAGAGAGNLDIDADNTVTIDAPTLDFDGTTINIGAGAATSATIGSTAGASSLTLQGGTGTVGITQAGGDAITIGQTGASGTGSTLGVPSFTTAQLGTNLTATNGMIAYDSTLGQLQGRIGGAWVDLGQGGGGGVLVQSVNTSTASVVTATGTIPQDDTIPQDTEGTTVLSLAITPTSTDNDIHIEFTCSGSVDGNQSVVVALFQDVDGTVADAIAVAHQGARNQADLTPQDLTLKHVFSPATTGTYTFEIRIGIPSGNYYVNGDSVGARLFGGASRATLCVEEKA